MAKIYTGFDVATDVNGVTKRLKRIEFNVNRAKFEALVTDSYAMERGSAHADAGITLVGQDSDDANAMTSAEAGQLVLAGAAPSALTWTDKAATPASKLPEEFFDYFPLSSWRFDDIKFGSAGGVDVNEWALTMTPGNINTPPAPPA